jgi:hypothetical protein
LACHCETSGETKVLPAPFRLPPLLLAAAKLLPNARQAAAIATAMISFLDTLAPSPRLSIGTDAARIEGDADPVG